jgi:hypothetical protein
MQPQCPCLDGCAMQKVRCKEREEIINRSQTVLGERVSNALSPHLPIPTFFPALTI